MMGYPSRSHTPKGESQKHGDHFVLEIQTQSPVKPQFSKCIHSWYAK